MNPLLRIIAVTAKDFQLICVMENGDKYLYDMSFVKYENQPILIPLKDIKEFKKVFIELGALVWPSGYEIHSDTILREGKLLIEKMNKAT